MRMLRNVIWICWNIWSGKEIEWKGRNESEWILWK